VTSVEMLYLDIYSQSLILEFSHIPSEDFSKPHRLVEVSFLNCPVSSMPTWHKRTVAIDLRNTQLLFALQFKAVVVPARSVGQPNLPSRKTDKPTGRPLQTPQVWLKNNSSKNYSSMPLLDRL
jgi:hypothetical protein